jgi:hypothetical protein
MPCNPQVELFLAVNSAHAFVVAFQAKYAAHMVKTQPKAPAFLMLKADDFTQLHGDLRIGGGVFGLITMAGLRYAKKLTCFASADFT